MNNIPKAVIIDNESKENIIKIDKSRLISLKKEMPYTTEALSFCGPLAVNRAGYLSGKSFVLSVDYDWILAQDEYGRTCLIPLKNTEK